MSEKTEMTIHRALSELKLIDSKIEKKITAFTPTVAKQSDEKKKINGSMTNDEFSNQVKADFDSIKSLIGLKNKIKSAIVQSNSVTMVTISGKSMTVADAISSKGTIEHKKRLIEKMKMSWNSSLKAVNLNVEKSQLVLNGLLEASLGKESIATRPDDVKDISDKFWVNNNWNVIDPIKVDDQIRSMEDEVSNFESEIDFVLSESNAITKITV